MVKIAKVACTEELPSVQKKTSPVLKEIPPLPEENRQEVPYGDPKCRLCRLPLEDLKLIHALKFSEKMSYKRMRAFLKERYKIGNDYTYLTKHFKGHVRQDKTKLLETSSKKTEIMEVLLSTGMGIGEKKHDQKLDKAYDKLVHMATKFTHTVDTLFDNLGVDFDKQLKEDFNSKASAITKLNLLAHLNRVAREQIKDISALRAPKMIVFQFLEDTFDKIITEVNEIITSLFIMVETEFADYMRQQGLEEKMSDRPFRDVFSKVALSYKDRILLLKREQLSQAAATLADLEKMI